MTTSNQAFPEGIHVIIADMLNRIKVLENKKLGSFMLEGSITAYDSTTGVKTVIGDLSSEGESRVGVKEWIGDTTPPPIPSVPVVSSTPGIFSIVWDGANMIPTLPAAPDFSHLNVYGVSSGSVYQIGVIKTKDEAAVYAHGQSDTDWTFYFTSVDKSGNESQPSGMSPSFTSIDIGASQLTTDAINAINLELDQAKQDALDLDGRVDTLSTDYEANKTAVLDKFTQTEVAFDQKIADIILNGTALYPDSGFETSNGSVTLSQNIARVNNNAHTGAYSIKFTTSGVSSDLTTPTPFIKLTSGRTVYTELWVKGVSTAPSMFRLNAVARNSSTQVVSAVTTVAEVAPTVGTYVKLSGYYTIPEGFDEVRVYPVIPASANAIAGRIAHIDDLMLYDATNAKSILDLATGAKSVADNATTKANTLETNLTTLTGIVGSKARVLYGTTAPSVEDQNSYTLWIDLTGNANTPKRWSGSAWVAVTDKAATDAANAATAANNLAASKTVTYYQTTAPTGTLVIGDLWIDTANKNTLKRWSGSAWVDVADQKLQDALTAAGTAQATADKKIITFAQTTAPTGLGTLDTGDLWVDTDDTNKMWRWSGTAWVDIRDTAAMNAALTSGEVVFSTATPTVAQQRSNVLWIDLTGGANTPKRWNGSAWVATQDGSIQKALDTANARIKTYTQTTAPTGLLPADAGHLWIDSDDRNRMYRWSGTAWVDIQDSAYTVAVNNSGEVVFSSTPPTVAQQRSNVLWIDLTGNANTPKRWNGSAWVATADKTIQDALTAANARIKTYAQTTAPTGLVAADAGHLWINTSANNKMMRWSGTAWVDVQDTAYTVAIAGASEIIIQTATPTTAQQKSNVLWIDITNNTNIAKRWSGSAWVAVQDKGIQDAAKAAADANTLAGQANTLAGTADSKASQAILDAASAAGIANAKARVLFGTTAPAAADQNSSTLWIDLTGNANTPKRWSGSAWVAVTDKAATDAANAATAANNLAASKTVTYYQTTAPTGTLVIGDLWIDTANKNTLKRWSGSAWVDVADQKLQDALTAAGTAQATADKKIVTYAQVSAPTGLTATNVGDLWIDTDDTNKMWRWSGTAWVDVRDMAGLNAALASGEVVFSASAPTVAQQRSNVLWIDLTGNANTPKRWNGSAWVATADKTIQDALTAANARIKTYAQTTAPTGLVAADAGHLWINTSANNKMMRWSGTAWVDVQDTAYVVAVDNSGEVVFSTTAPSGTKQRSNVLWIDLTGGANTPKRWNGSAWVATQDKTIQDALDTAKARIKTYTQTTAPTGLLATDAGHLWIDSDDRNRMYRWSGTAWVDIQDSSYVVAIEQSSEVLFQTTTPTGTQQRSNVLWIDITDGLNVLKRWSGSAWVAVPDNNVKSVLEAQINDMKAQGTSLFPDPSFESGRGPFISAESYVVRDNTQARTGTWSMKLTTNGNSSSNAFTYSNYCKLTEGRTAYAEIWIKGVTGTPMPSQVELWFASRNSQTSAVTSNTVAASVTPVADQWVKLSGYYTVPSGYDQIRVFPLVRPTDNAVAGKVVWLDDFLVVDGTEAKIALDLADSKIKTHIQGTAPTGLNTSSTGDIWINTSDKNHLWRWSGTAWIDIRDTAASDEVKVSSEIIYSISTPSADRERSNVLWIDMSSGSNVLKRWNGTAWVQVTDKSLTTAVQDLTAIKATYDTVSANANNAFTRTGQMLDSATGLNKMYYLAALPSGTNFVVGDTVFIRASGTAPITAQYRWNGTAWVSETLSNSVIANLDAGKLESGFISAARLASKSITVDKLVVSSSNNLNIDPMFQYPSTWWVMASYAGTHSDYWSTAQLYETSVASIKMTALAPTSTKQSVSSARLGTHIPVSPDQAYTGTAYMYSTNTTDTYTDIRLKVFFYNKTGTIISTQIAGKIDRADITANTWMKLGGSPMVVPAGASQMNYEVEVTRPAGAVANTSVNTATFYYGRLEVYRAMEGSLIVDGTIIGNHIKGGSITGTHIKSDAFEGKTYTGGTFTGAVFQSDAEVSKGLKINSTGVKIFSNEVQADGTYSDQPVIQLGTGGSASFSTNDSSGTPLGSVDVDGSASFTSLSVTNNDFSLSGRPLIGDFPEDDVDTVAVSSTFLQALPWGIRGHISRGDQSNGPYAGGVEHRLLQMEFRARPYRTYRFTINPGHFSLSTATAQVSHRLRYTWGTTVNPDHTSSLLESWGHEYGVSTAWDSREHTFVWMTGSADDDVMRVLYSINPISGSLTYINGASWRGIYMTVEDIGPAIGLTGSSRGGSSASSTETVPVTKKTYTSAWYPGTNDYRSFFNNGSSIQASGAGSAQLKQGLDPYWSAGGRQTSLTFFNYANQAQTGQTGTTLTNALSGATVTKASVSVKMVYPSSGSKTVRAYWHQQTSLPTSYVPSESGLLGEFSVSSGSRVTIPLNSSAIAALKNGTFGGVGFGSIGASSPNASKYSLGLARGAYPPVLSVTYTK